MPVDLIINPAWRIRGFLRRGEPLYVKRTRFNLKPDRAQELEEGIDLEDLEGSDEIVTEYESEDPRHEEAEDSSDIDWDDWD